MKCWGRCSQFSQARSSTRANLRSLAVTIVKESVGRDEQVATAGPLAGPPEAGAKIGVGYVGRCLDGQDFEAFEHCRNLRS